MALKVSGKGKPGQAEGSYKKGQRSYPDFDAISEGVPYPGSSTSTPAWDFTSTGQRPTRPDSRLSAFGGDRTPGGVSISAQSGEVVLEDEDESKEWAAQVEPGVQITFVSLPRGGNDLKRIRFRYLLVTIIHMKKLFLYYIYRMHTSYEIPLPKTGLISCSC